jgi:hypothetical protein
MLAPGTLSGDNAFVARNVFPRLQARGYIECAPLEYTMSKPFNPSGKFGSRERGIIADDNEGSPPFVALIGDTYVESGDNLEELIRILVEEGTGDDIVVWECWKTVAAVIRSTGEVIRLPVPRRKPAKDDTGARLQALLLKRKPKS